MRIEWTPAETKSLKATLLRHTSLVEALAEHNRRWKTGRTRSSSECHLRNVGIRYGELLKKTVTAVGADHASDSIQALVSLLRRRPNSSIGELCDRLNCPPSVLSRIIEEARSAGHRIKAPAKGLLMLDIEIPQVDRLRIHRLPILPIRDEIVFASISDIHIGSSCARQECLEDFVRIAYHDFGVRLITISGDLLAGLNMYPGQLSELEAVTFDAQASLLEKRLPKLQGLAYHAILGNHDHSFIKAIGADVFERLRAGRPDITGYGFYSALIDLIPEGRESRVKVELWHPDKAGAYARFYHQQRGVDAIPPGMKAQIILAGHEHIAALLPSYRGVAVFGCGCFEDQTLFLKRKHASPDIGGWIMRLGIAKDGTVRTVTPTWVGYYHSSRGSLIGRSGDEEIRLDRSVGIRLAH